MQRAGRTRKVDREEVDNELRDLQRGEVLLPPDLVAGGGHEVVVVLHRIRQRSASRIMRVPNETRPTHHQDVNEEVEGDDDPGDGSPAIELGVAEDGSRGVVEHVQELERLLLDDEEARVKQLPVCSGGRSASQRLASGAGGRSGNTHT